MVRNEEYIAAVVMMGMLKTDDVVQYVVLLSNTSTHRTQRERKEIFLVIMMVRMPRTQYGRRLGRWMVIES